MLPRAWVTDMRSALQISSSRARTTAVDHLIHDLYGGVVKHLPGRHNQLDHGRGGGVVRNAVREVLANARSVPEVNDAILAEIKRVTGRNLTVDMAGSDVQVAREHGEGLLRMFERFPNAPVTRVLTYGPGGSDPDVGGEGFDNAYAFAVQVSPTRTWIAFNTKYASNLDRYRESLAHEETVNWAVSVSPQSTAIHEFGHALAVHSDAEQPAYRLVKEIAQHNKTTVPRTVKAELTTYAATNMRELAAEAVADVMENGDNASELSHRIFDLIEQRYKTRYDT